MNVRDRVEERKRKKLEAEKEAKDKAELDRRFKEEEENRNRALNTCATRDHGHEDLVKRKDLEGLAKEKDLEGLAKKEDIPKPYVLESHKHKTGDVEDLATHDEKLCRRVVQDHKNLKPEFLHEPKKHTHFAEEIVSPIDAATLQGRTVEDLHKDMREIYDDKKRYEIPIGGGIGKHGNDWHTDPAGLGDMTKDAYDTTATGSKVDTALNAEKLDGSTKAQVQDHAPKSHGNEAHSSTFITQGAVDTHAGLTTGIHGVGAGTIAKVADVAVDANLSAAAQDAVSKRHSQNTDTDLDSTFEATFEKVANKNAANGYAGLSAGSKVAASQMAAGTVAITLSFSIAGALTTGQKTQRLLAPCAITLTKVRLVVDTAPTGANLIIDVHTGTGTGTTIFTTQGNRPTITATNKTGVSAAPDVTSIAEGDEFSVYVDQIGSTIAGSDLTIEVIGTQAVAFI